MAFTYGPAGQPIEVPDQGDPLTLYYLGRCLALLESVSAADAAGTLPEPLKAAMDKLVSEAGHYVKTKCGGAPG